MSRGLRVEPDDVPCEAERPANVVDTILDNVAGLDQMLDEGSRKKLGGLPYLELSKYLKIKKAG
jgi:hypothetical protein